MIPALATSLQPIPENLKLLLPNSRTPWNVSSTLFNRVQAQPSDQPFKLCEVLSSDPDFNFILKYFEHQKPVGYSIKRVVCIHNSDHTQVFEGTLKNQEREASNLVFAPMGKNEEPKLERARVLSRWETQAAQFSPVEVKSSNSRQLDICSKAKVLPLWHGSSEFVCKSVCSSGFTSFGKHHYFDESAMKGNTKSTDKGYFGAGIYFTNSASYASMYSSGGNLILSWVSMREPYPVVNDKPHPQKGSDMLKLEGRMHYQNYNAHFIPVASIRPQDPKCLEYYPCYKDQAPAWDEFVVFHTSQALPRFWIELEVDFPKVTLSDLRTAGELLSILFKLLDKKEIQNHVELSQILQVKIEGLMEIPELTPLDREDQKFLKLAKKAMTEGESLSLSVVNMLVKKVKEAPEKGRSRIKKEKNVHKKEKKRLEKLSTPAPISVTNLAPALPTAAVKAPAQSQSSVKVPIPAVAFGKELWAKYLGDVSEEPPLPSDIEKILQSSCPFNPGKKVEETHLLILIPKTVNGNLLTLNSLGDLVKHPKKGSATKYKMYWVQIMEQYGFQPLPQSYWILFTKDVIPRSRNKSYNAQVQLLKTQSEKAHLMYDVPQLLEAATCIFMEYLRNGKRLYNDSPNTYTRCHERVSEHLTWPLAVGGFAADGLKVTGGLVGNEEYGIGGVRKL